MSERVLFISRRLDLCEDVIRGLTLFLGMPISIAESAEEASRMGLKCDLIIHDRRKIHEIKRLRKKEIVDLACDVIRTFMTGKLDMGPRNASFSLELTNRI